MNGITLATIWFNVTCGGATPFSKTPPSPRRRQKRRLKTQRYQQREEQEIAVWRRGAVPGCLT